MNHEQFNDRVEISPEARILAGGQGRSPEEIHDCGATVFGVACGVSGLIVGAIIYAIFKAAFAATL